MKHLFVILLLVVMSCSKNKQVTDHLKLNPKLEGKWVAKAFDGELHETWYLNHEGWMEQTVYYIEAQDTSYRALGRIEKINGDIVLMSIIKEGTPKIFKSVTFSDSVITFENKDYKNPYLVVYEFTQPNAYRRTITGKENDSLVVYTFDFEKVNE